MGNVSQVSDVALGPLVIFVVLNSNIGVLWGILCEIIAFYGYQSCYDVMDPLHTPAADDTRKGVHAFPGFTSQHLSISTYSNFYVAVAIFTQVYIKFVEIGL